MGNFADCFLVKLSPENDLISLTTYDIFHGKSCRFLMMKSKLEEMMLPDAQPILDTDSVLFFSHVSCLIASLPAPPV